MEYLSKGHTHRSNKELGVGKSSIIKWRKMLREKGTLADERRQRTTYKIPDEDLRAYIAANPDSYFTEISAYFECSDEGIR